MSNISPLSKNRDRATSTASWSLRSALRRNPEQILPVTALGQGFGLGGELIGADIALAEGDLFRTADLEPLPAFDHMHEFRRLQQALMGARIKPGDAAAHFFHRQRSLLEINTVDVGDFQF